jgi:hypothetical protein
MGMLFFEKCKNVNTHWIYHEKLSDFPIAIGKYPIAIGKYPIYEFSNIVQWGFSNSKLIAPASPCFRRGNSKAMPLGCKKWGEIQGLFRRKSLKAWPTVGKMGKKHISCRKKTIIILTL